LREEQDDLVRRVAAAQPRTVVVVNAGAPVLMPWRDDVAAIVHLWYPGQEGGAALADVLSGDVNPSGRLPTTFPAALTDSPAHHASDPAQYPGVDGQVHYGEDLLIGYRWFDAHGIEPQWCCGHGLSYADFSWSPPTVTVDEGLVSGPVSADELPQGPAVATVTLEVTNTAHRDGHEVVQVYVAQPQAPGRPRRQLAGFTRAWVPSGSSVPVSIDLPLRAFAAWDDETRRWVVRPGRYEVVVGASSRLLRGTVTVDVASVS
jgi:beta-glucosidase